MTIKPAGKIAIIVIILGVFGFLVYKKISDKKTLAPVEVTVPVPQNDSVEPPQNAKHAPEVTQPKKQPSKPVVKPEPKKETPKEKKKGERENLPINF